jgi:exopolyphosphatase / guanosine-5'-triphosphate,3'-diphosphate pyrophosphatase
MRVAVIDLGSSSFRLVVAEATTRGRIRHVTRKREEISLGLAVGREGRILPGEAKATVEAALRLKARAAREDVDDLIVVATSALREAENADEMQDRLEAGLGQPVRFLSGHEEAALTYAAMSARMDLGADPALAIDLGGGSLELATGRGGALDRTWSLPLGAARLTGRFIRHDPMTADERDRLGVEIRATLRPALNHGASVPRVVAAGGAVKAMARLMSQGRGSLRGTVLTTESLWWLRDRLVNSSHEARLDLPGMARRRASVVPAAAVVVTTLLAMLRVPTVIVSEWGVREGIILQAVGLVPEMESAA